MSQKATEQKKSIPETGAFTFRPQQLYILIWNSQSRDEQDGGLANPFSK
jgi:hypothetical protein